MRNILLHATGTSAFQKKENSACPSLLRTVKMGIQGLTKLIADNAPEVLKENVIANYFGRLVGM